MKSLIKYIHVIITYQSNRALEKILTGGELMSLSGSINVKSLDVIDWDVNINEYRRAA